MADTAEKGCIQIIAYIKRNPSITSEEFYNHWKNVHAPKVNPWAEKHGIRRYQQIHTTGKIIPNTLPLSSPLSPNSNSTSISTSSSPAEIVDFDGIAMFLVRSDQHLTHAFNDSYFRDVIEPDERVFLDKEGTHGAVVATFKGEMFDMVLRGASTLGTEGEASECREKWVEYERRARKGKN